MQDDRRRLHARRETGHPAVRIHRDDLPWCADPTDGVQMLRGREPDPPSVGIPVDDEDSRSRPGHGQGYLRDLMGVPLSDKPVAFVNRTLRDGSARYLRSHRRLLWGVTRNELSARYAGSHLGMFWVMLAPTLVLAVYAVTYVAIFKIRLAGLTSTEYVIFIFSGLVPYLMAADALANGVGSVIANKSVLSNTVFPIDLAPVKAVLTSQVIMAVGMGVTIIGSALVGTLRWTVVLLPPIWALQALGLIGIVWFISLLNVIFRDIQNFLTPILMMMLIISPIAYTPEIVPESLKPLILLNPFAYFVVAYQQILVLGLVPSLAHSAVMVVLAVVPFLLGSWFFATAKRVIVDYV